MKQTIYLSIRRQYNLPKKIMFFSVYQKPNPPIWTSIIRVTFHSNVPTCKSDTKKQGSNTLSSQLPATRFAFLILCLSSSVSLHYSHLSKLNLPQHEASNKLAANFLFKQGCNLFLPNTYKHIVQMYMFINCQANQHIFGNSYSGGFENIGVKILTFNKTILGRNTTSLYI